MKIKLTCSHNSNANKRQLEINNIAVRIKPIMMQYDQTNER